MPDATVATYLDEPLNVEIDLAPQFSFHFVIAIDNLSNPADIPLAKILDFGIRSTPVCARILWLTERPIP